MSTTALRRILIATIYCSLAISAFSNGIEKSRILILGDSLSAGYGIDPELAYPNLIASKIESLNLPFEVSPSGLSGETSAGGLRRANWVMQKPIGILILALGSNDGLRGIDLSDTKRNLQGIIDIAKEKNPQVEIVIAGMQMPPNLGDSYTSEFKDLFPKLAVENNAILIPFLLEGVAGNPDLNIQDGIHPNPEGQKIVAENVWEKILPLLERFETQN